MWNLDLALADVVSTTSEPALGAIRLAWWRERLEALDSEGAPAGEPRLSAIERQLLGRGITGHELSRLEYAWLPLLNPFPWGKTQADGLRLRGRLLFGIGARLLGGHPVPAEACGEVWSIEDGASHCSDEGSRMFLVGEATRAVFSLPAKISTKLRPLTILAALAAFDLSPAGRFGRGGAALKHRLTGRFPR